MQLFVLLCNTGVKTAVYITGTFYKLPGVFSAVRYPRRRLLGSVCLLKGTE